MQRISNKKIHTSDDLVNFYMTKEIYKFIDLIFSNNNCTISTICVRASFSVFSETLILFFSRIK